MENNDLSSKIDEYLSNPQEPCSVSFWPKKEESYLTLSVKIHEQDEKAVREIKKLQEKIISNLINTKIVRNPYKINHAVSLFKYPEDRLHFSLINFLTSANDFDIFIYRFKKEPYYSELKKEIIKIINNSLSCKLEAEIAGLHPGSQQCQTIDSFSLQIFLDIEFINKLKEMSKNFIENKEIDNKISKLSDCRKDGKIKGFPSDNPERFPINILRFINLSGWPQDIESNKELVKSKLKAINNQYKNNREKRISFKIKKIILVESDPFLCRWNKVEEFPLS